MKLYLNYSTEVTEVPPSPANPQNYATRAEYDNLSLSLNPEESLLSSTLKTDGNFKVGDSVYLVYAIYSTGDSENDFLRGEIAPLFVSEISSEATDAYNLFKSSTDTYVTVGDNYLYVPWNTDHNWLDEIQILRLTVA